jgi:hypothetical protein
MPNRSTLDQFLPAYIVQAALANPQNVTPGFDTQGCDAVTFFINVTVAGAGAVATIYESTDNATFTPVADPALVVSPTGPGNTVSLAATGVQMLSYVGNKRYCCVRNSGGTPTVSVLAVGEYQNITDRAKTI